MRKHLEPKRGPTRVAARYRPIGTTAKSDLQWADLALPTDRTAVGPTCYTVPAAFTPTGSMSLELKVVFGSTSDRILLGLTAVSGQSA